MGEWTVGYMGKRDRATGTKTFTFERPGDLRYLPGQFFFVTIPAEDGGGKLRHHFSFSSSPTEAEVEFTTRMTGHAFKDRLDALAPGTRVELSGPEGEFVARPEMDKIAYVVGGIGITPARSTVRWALDTHQPLDIVVLYGNRDLESTAFREEFDHVRSDHIHIVNVLSHPQGEWSGPTGHIDAEIVRAEIPDWSDRHFFVSGPPAMVESLRQMLADEVGVAADRLLTEDFLGYQRDPQAP
jgi:ferredoxin-NADP reductase